jgi:hypothetical protein
MGGNETILFIEPNKVVEGQDKGIGAERNKYEKTILRKNWHY